MWRVVPVKGSQPVLVQLAFGTYSCSYLKTTMLQRASIQLSLVYK